MNVTEEEISKILNRYIFLINALDNVLKRIEPGMKKDERWFSIAPMIGRKFWKQALSLEILFKHDWSIKIDGQEKVVLDISSYYSLIRAMFEGYVEENIIRFRLWEMDGLKSRLNFQIENSTTELIHRLEGDRKYIDSIQIIIQQFDYYKNLKPAHQTYLLKFSAWRFSNESLQRADKNKWQHSIKEIIDRTKIKQSILNDMYSYYSMHVHTGYISILQNDEFPEEEREMTKWVAIMNASFVTAYFIQELSKMFVEGEEFHESLTEKERNCLSSFKKQ